MAPETFDLLEGSFTSLFERLDSLEIEFSTAGLVEASIRFGVLVGRAQVNARGDEMTARLLHAASERIQALEGRLSPA